MKVAEGRKRSAVTSEARVEMTLTLIVTTYSRAHLGLSTINS